MLNGHDRSDEVPAKEAARIIGVAPKTLMEWRKRHCGPPFIALVGRIYYRRTEIAAWKERITKPS